jgi:hypothetical protein
MFLVVNADRLLLLLRPARRKFLIPFQSFGAITAFPRNFGTDGGSDNQVEVKWRQLVARLASPKLKRCLIARVKVARDRNRQYCVGEQCHVCLRPVESERRAVFFRNHSSSRDTRSGGTGRNGLRLGF